MADHQHGQMTTKVQEDTYNGFITFVTRSCIAAVAIAVFLAIFAT